MSSTDSKESAVDVARHEPVQGKPAGFSRKLYVLLALYALFTAWNLPRRDFWRAEAGEALVARNIERDALNPVRWVLPTLDGTSPYLARAPLSYWLPAALHLVIPLEPRLVYRLPAVAFGVLGLWLTYLLGKKLFSEEIGFLASAVQATGLLYFVEAGTLGSDLLFAVSVEAAILGFVLAAEEPGRAACRWCGWAGLAAAALTKSLPLALVVVFLPLALYHFFGGGLIAVRLGLGALRGPAALLVALPIAWYLAAAVLAPSDLFAQHFLAQHLERLSESPRDRAPPYYYVLALLWAFLPWTLFVPLGLYHGKDRTSRRGQRLAVVWSLGLLVALSLVSAKRAPYLLAFWPALALLIPAAFYETEEKFSLWEDYLGPVVFKAVPPLLKISGAVCVALAAGWIAGLEKRIAELDPSLEGLLPGGAAALPFALLCIVAGGVLYLASIRVQRLLPQGNLPGAALELAGAVLFFFFAGTFIAPLANEQFSARSFLERVAKEAGDAPLATYGYLRPPEILYFLDREVPHFEELVVDAEEGTPEYEPYRKLREFLESSPRVYVLVPERELKGLEYHFPELYSTESRSILEATDLRGVLGRGEAFVLLRKRPA